MLSAASSQLTSPPPIRTVTEGPSRAISPAMCAIQADSAPKSEPWNEDEVRVMRLELVGVQIGRLAGESHDACRRNADERRAGLLPGPPCGAHRAHVRPAVDDRCAHARGGRHQRLDELLDRRSLRFGGLRGAPDQDEHRALRLEPERIQRLADLLLPADSHGERSIPVREGDRERACHPPRLHSLFAGRVTAAALGGVEESPDTAGQDAPAREAAKADGKWHRKQTAGRESPESRPVRVKRWGKSPPAALATGPAR